MRKPKDIENELRTIINQMLVHRDALQALDIKRQELVKEYRGFSSSITSSSIVGSPGVIQGPPPEKKIDK